MSQTEKTFILTESSLLSIEKMMEMLKEENMFVENIAFRVLDILDGMKRSPTK